MTNLNTSSSLDLLKVYIGATEILQHGVIWLNKDGRILGTNTQFVKDLGYEGQDISTKTIFQINPYTNLIQWRRLWKELLEQNQITLETEHITADGDIFPVKMRGILIDVGSEIVCCAFIEDLLNKNAYQDLMELASNIAGIGSWQLNLIHKEWFFSKGLRDILNLSEDFLINAESIKRLLAKFLEPNVAVDLMELVEISIKTGKRFEMELPLRMGDEQPYAQFRIIGEIVFIEGRALKMYGILQDISNISDRTEEMYFTKYSIDKARDIICWIDREGNIEYVNDQMCKTLGYTHQELLKKKLQDIAPNIETKHWQADWALLEKETSIEKDIVFQSKKGVYYPIHILVSHARYRGRNLGCLFGRNRAIKKQRDELMRLTYHTLNQANDMIYWLRSDGTFIYANQTFYEKVGYSESEVSKMRLLDFFPEHSEKEFRTNWEKLQKGEIISSDNLKITTKHGKKIPVENYITLTEYQGEECSCVILRDISERKQKEEELAVMMDQLKVYQNRLEMDNQILKEQIHLKYSFNNIISKDKNYKRVLQQVEQVADTDATVLILGETGTGKELLAKAIHQLSSRSRRTMVKVNCAALPKNLVESELFGHEKGAFTGAFIRKIGRFELADQGTLFLDEIGELPLDVQVKLLRVLQEKEFERIGGNETIKVDVRVIAATNRNLEALVEKGEFREDLYYRLNVFPIQNIPLRDRKSDIPLLIRHFTEKFSQKINKPINKIPQSLLEYLTDYPFPGNVRELENMIERAVIIADSDILKINLNTLQKPGNQCNGNAPFRSMDNMQRAHILTALKYTRGVVSGSNGAARLLQMNDKTLISRMKKLGVNRKDYLNSGRTIN